MKRALWLFSGFGGRLVLPALAVALAIAALWWILLDRLQREERLLDLTAHEKTAVVARLVEEHAVSTFRRVDDLLLDLIANTEHNRSMRLESRRAFEEGLVVGVRVYDASGLLTMGGARVTFQGSITDRDEFRIARDTAPRGLVVGVPYASSETQDLLIPASRRLENADGTFAGIAIADIPVESFARYYRVLGLPPDGAAALLRSDGVVIARSGGMNSASGRNPANTELWQAIKRHPIGHIRMISPVDGVERITAFRSAPDYPAIAVVGESVETVFGPWRDNARLYIGWAVATTVVILLFVIAFIVELQWRRHTDRALRVRNRALAWSNDGIMIADATQPGMPIVYVNPALEQLLGVPMSALMGAGALTALERATNDRAALQPLRDAIVVGRDARVELTRPGPVADELAEGGPENEPKGARCLELSASPVRDHDNRLVSLIATVRDISEHKRVQGELADARREADRANVAKSKFLAAASHDLRQPVQSLYLFTAALSDRLQGHSALPILDNIRQGLDTLKSLLDGLLDMSRLESGKIVAAPVEVRLNQLLGRLVAEYGPRAAQKGLELRAVPTRVWVRTDPAHLERILRNLVENALRYTAKGKVLLGCRRTPSGMRVEVWDTGSGIPADRLEDIFEEFTQLGERSERGLGLGLAIVKRLSRLLGHPVTVRSWEGKGSVFSVELPRVILGTPRAANGTAAAAATLARRSAANDAADSAANDRGQAISAIANAFGGGRNGGGAAKTMPAPLAAPPVAMPATVAAGFAAASGAAASGTAKGMVLVIDDEAIILLGLKAILEGWGYDVLTAKSGDQALERLRADGRCPQIVLADYQLQQGRTGPEAVSAVQTMLGQTVPGIILTGDTNPERQEEAERRGFRLLHKPVFPNDLRRMMASAGAA